MPKAFIICIRFDEKTENAGWYYENFYKTLNETEERLHLSLTISSNIEFRDGPKQLQRGMFKVNGDHSINEVVGIADSAARSAPGSSVIVFQVEDSPEFIKECRLGPAISRPSPSGKKHRLSKNEIDGFVAKHGNASFLWGEESVPPEKLVLYRQAGRSSL